MRFYPCPKCLGSRDNLVLWDASIIHQIRQDGNAVGLTSDPTDASLHDHLAPGEYVLGRPIPERLVPQPEQDLIYEPLLIGVW